MTRIASDSTYTNTVSSQQRVAIQLCSEYLVETTK
jgi:hypothetical protein